MANFYYVQFWVVDNNKKLGMKKLMFVQVKSFFKCRVNNCFLNFVEKIFWKKVDHIENFVF